MSIVVSLNRYSQLSPGFQFWSFVCSEGPVLVLPYMVIVVNALGATFLATAAAQRRGLPSASDIAASCPAVLRSLGSHVNHVSPVCHRLLSHVANVQCSVFRRLY